MSAPRLTRFPVQGCLASTTTGCEPTPGPTSSTRWSTGCRALIAQATRVLSLTPSLPACFARRVRSVTLRPVSRSSTRIQRQVVIAVLAYPLHRSTAARRSRTWRARRASMRRAPMRCTSSLMSSRSSLSSRSESSRCGCGRARSSDLHGVRLTRPSRSLRSGFGAKPIVGSGIDLAAAQPQRRARAITARRS